MKTTKRKGLGSESGQVLPITVLFMGVIIGAAAISIDVAKVSALRNQAQTATSAAALAAAQTLAGELQAGYSSSSVDTINSPKSPTQEADIIYHSNIETAIPNSGLSKPPIVKYYLGTGSPVTVLPSSINSTQLPIYITVQASGSTPMNFAAALGVSSAKVTPLATAVVTTQTEASTTGMAPLAIPACSASSISSNSCNAEAWNDYLAKGLYFYAYRGDSGSSKSEPQTGSGTVSSPIPIRFLNVYGAGETGWLSLSSFSYLSVGQDMTLVKDKTGTSSWNARKLSTEGISRGAMVYFPVGNSTSGNGHEGIQIVGFITAMVTSISGQNGTHASFTFQVLSDVALNDTNNFTPSSPSTNVNYLAQLVSNKLLSQASKS